LPKKKACCVGNCRKCLFTAMHEENAVIAENHVMNML
jgi:hypothetical protein